MIVKAGVSIINANTYVVDRNRERKYLKESVKLYGEECIEFSKNDNFIIVRTPFNNKTLNGWGTKEINEIFKTLKKEIKK